MTANPTFDINEVKWPGKIFVAKRAVKKFNELTSFFTEAYDELYQFAGRKGHPPMEPPFAVYFSVNEDQGETDIAAAVPIGIHTDTENFEEIEIPAGNALLVHFKGDYNNMGAAYAALNEYLKTHNLESEWMLEQYMNDPTEVKSPDELLTDIYFVLK